MLHEVKHIKPIFVSIYHMQLISTSIKEKYVYCNISSIYNTSCDTAIPSFSACIMDMDHKEKIKQMW